MSESEMLRRLGELSRDNVQVHGWLHTYRAGRVTRDEMLVCLVECLANHNRELIKLATRAVELQAPPIFVMKANPKG